MSARVLLAAGLVALGACDRAPPRSRAADAAPAVAPAADAAGARGLMEAQVAAWNRGDLGAFMATYWRSPELVLIGDGSRIDGFDAMLERYARRFGEPPQGMGTLAYSDLEVLPFGDGALARGRWSLLGPDGGERAGFFTMLLRRVRAGEGEAWRVVHDHTASVP